MSLKIDDLNPVGWCPAHNTECVTLRRDRIMLNALVSIMLREGCIPEGICEQMVAAGRCRKCRYQTTPEKCLKEWLVMKLDENEEDNSITLPNYP